MIAVNKENNMDINHFKEQVLKQKQIEENLEQQQQKLEQCSALKKQLESMFDMAESEIMSALVKDIYNTQSLIARSSNDLDIIKKEIISQKYLIGQKFNDCIEFLEDEIKNIKEDKRIERICAFVESIKTIDDELHEIKDVLIMMSDAKEDIPCSENKETQDDKDYPLPLSKQFSAYEMYNRKGFSMKDFSIRHKKDFVIVYNHFNKDIEKTIEYLQTRHGLCSSTYIDARAFKNKYFPSI